MIMDPRHLDVFNALSLMLESFADQNNYYFTVDDACEYQKVRYTFRRRGTDRRFASVVSYRELTTKNLCYLFEGITGRAKRALQLEGERYIDTDIAQTRVLADDRLNAMIDAETLKYIKRVMNSTYGKFGTHCVPDKAIIKKVPEIKDVIFKDPATIVFWGDGTKTVVKTQEGDIYDPEKGLAMAICKKRGGNKWDYYNTFKHWLKKYKPETGDVETVTHITKTIKEDNNG